MSARFKNLTMRLVLICFCNLLGASQLCANLFLEPMVGVSWGSQLQYNYLKNSYAYDSSSLPLGGRIGWRGHSGLWSALRILSSSNGLLVPTTTGYTDSYTRLSKGIDIGWASERGFGLFVGYDLDHRLKVVPDSVNINSPTEFSGTAMSFGVGYKFMKWMGIEIVYVVPTYTKGANVDKTFSSFGSDNYTAITDTHLDFRAIFPIEF